MNRLHRTIAVCGHVSLMELSQILDVSAEVLVDDLELLVANEAVTEIIRHNLPTLYRTAEVEARMMLRLAKAEAIDDRKATVKNVNLLMVLSQAKLKKFTANGLTTRSGMSRADVDEAILKLIGEGSIRIKGEKEYMGKKYKEYEVV